MGCITLTNTAPKIPAIGSTRPLNCPYQIAFPAENPAAFSGKLTAKPSGKFWMPEIIEKSSNRILNQTPTTVTISTIPTVEPTGCFDLFLEISVHPIQ